MGGTAEIPGVDIRQGQGSVGDVDTLPVNEVVQAVFIGLPPVLGCLFWHWWKWGECLWVVAGCGM